MAHRTPKAPEPPPRQGALAHADTAVGRADLRAGFGETAEDDLLFALGWPHLIWLVPGDAKPAVLAADPSKFSATHTFELGPTPIAVAPRMLRHLHAYRNHRERWHAAIQDPAPLAEHELAPLVEFATREQFGTVVCFLLEALTSPRAVLDALVPRLEQVPLADWRQGMFEAFGGGCLHALHYLLLRDDADHAAAMRARLEAIHARLADDRDTRPARVLDLSLHGSAATHEVSFYHLDHLRDDRALARGRFLAHLDGLSVRDRVGFDARVAFLGGDDVIRACAANAKVVHSTARESTAVGFARIAHPAVRDLMAALGSKTAKAWLKTHA